MGNCKNQRPTTPESSILSIGSRTSEPTPITEHINALLRIDVIEKSEPYRFIVHIHNSGRNSIGGVSLRIKSVDEKVKLANRLGTRLSIGDYRIGFTAKGNGWNVRKERMNWIIYASVRYMPNDVIQLIQRNKIIAEHRQPSAAPRWVQVRRIATTWADVKKRK